MARGLLSTQHWPAAPLRRANLTLSSLTLRMTPRCPRAVLAAIAETPPTPTVAKVTWRRMGQMAFTLLSTSITHCSDGVMGIILIMSCQVSIKVPVGSFKIKESVWCLNRRMIIFLNCLLLHLFRVRQPGCSGSQAGDSRATQHVAS